MKLLTSTILSVSLLSGSMAFAQGDKEIANARAATEHWMKLMDTEEFAAAWSNSSEGLRKEMSKFTWSVVGNGKHLALGDFKSRAFKSANIKQAASGKTESVSFEYVSVYTKKPTVYESITAIHEADGVWRVTGYNFSDEKK